MNTLFLAWRAPAKRWHPIGYLAYRDGVYTFGYVHGVRTAEAEDGFRPLIEFPRFDREFRSARLFSVFANRLPPQTRPDYAAFVDWLNLAPGDVRDVDLLARSEGRRVTDTFEVFPKPERTEDGRYVVHAFIHGIRHREPTAVERAERLQPGEPLVLRADADNPADALAVATHTGDTDEHIGFLPRYLAEDVQTLGVERVTATVERVNRAPVPIQFRVLCQIEAAWPTGFEACAGAEFEPLAVGACVP